MAQKAVGVYQLPNGNWEYRIRNKYINTNCRTDDNGNPFTTQRAAKEARAKRLLQSKVEKERQVTLQEVYDRYMATGIADKAPATIRKQETMWNEHIKMRFGKMAVDDIKIGMLSDYLSELYNYGDKEYKNSRAPQSYSYAYVEGYLKFFYLLFNRAYEYGAISTERYVKDFENRGTRLTMPPKRQLDYEEGGAEAQVYTPIEIHQITDVLKDTTVYTAFLLGYMLGVRISECFALRWQNIDWKHHTITINRQMLYDEKKKIFYLGPVKTLKSSRTIDMPKMLQNHLKKVHDQQQQDRKKYGLAYKDNEVIGLRMHPNEETFLEKEDKDFINRREDGELLTSNSFKYWAKEIKRKTDIDFRYHSLRKTHATMMANMNTPALELQNRLGHLKYETTMQYYINTNMLAKEVTLHNIEQLQLEVAPTVRGKTKLHPVLQHVLEEEKEFEEKHTPREWE